MPAVNVKEVHWGWVAASQARLQSTSSTPLPQLVPEEVKWRQHRIASTGRRAMNMRTT